MLPNQTALPVSRSANFFVAAILLFVSMVFASLSFASVSFAQESATQTPPQYLGVQTHVDGVFVTPVANVPLTAVVEVTSTQTLGDGTTVSKKTFNNIARDSQGRIYNEYRSMVPETSNATPVILAMHIFDPTTKLNTFLEPNTHIARQSTFDRPSTASPSPAPGIPAGSPALARRGRLESGVSRRRRRSRFRRTTRFWTRPRPTDNFFRCGVLDGLRRA